MQTASAATMAGSARESRPTSDPLVGSSCAVNRSGSGLVVWATARPIVSTGGPKASRICPHGGASGLCNMGWRGLARRARQARRPLAWAHICRAPVRAAPATKTTSKQHNGALVPPAARRAETVGELGGSRVAPLRWPGAAACCCLPAPKQANIQCKPRTITAPPANCAPTPTRIWLARISSARPRRAKIISLAPGRPQSNAEIRCVLQMLKS